MKKLTMPVLLGILCFLHPFDLLAKSICLTDALGTYFVLAGGKVDQKPYAGKFENQFCHGTLSAAIVTIAPGTVSITMEGNGSSPCSNFLLVADTNTSFQGWSILDTNEDGISNGKLYLTPVSCGSVQGMMPVPSGAAQPDSLTADTRNP